MVSVFSLHNKAKAAFVLSSARSSGVMTSSEAAPASIAVGSPNNNIGTSSGNMIITSDATKSAASGSELLDNSALMTGDAVNLNSSTSRKQSQIGPIHFCFIVHGHKGHANDLWYLHQSVRDKAKELNVFHHVESSEKCGVGANLIAKSNEQKVSDETVSEKRPRRNKRDRLSLHLKLKKKSLHNHSEESVDNSTENESGLDGTSSSDPLVNENGADTKDQVSNDKFDLDPEKMATASSFIVHNSACNGGKTDDGVINGGNRLADEILEVIRHEVDKKKKLSGSPDSLEGSSVDVTISLIGNSLGGLYTRYAVARLAELAEETPVEGADEKDTTAQEQRDYYIFKDGKSFIRLHFNVFCSTAAPHLGCADHTYFPIPRMAEKGIAYGLGETGRDLFRVNNLLHEMATQPKYLKPLGRFRKRIAYANAYGTDFVVPTLTAAFLDEDSHSLHYFDEYLEENIDQAIVEDIKHDLDATTLSEAEAKINPPCPAKELGLVVATFHTKQESFEEAAKTTESKKDLTVMSISLDALGWKKVFVDIRKEIPLAVSIPIGSNHSSHCPIEKLKSSNRVVESRELAKVVSGNPSKALLSLPLGHNAIVAMSRGAVTMAMNGGGMPIVDSLAIQLTSDISSW